MTKEALCARTHERCPTAEACLEANHCAKWDDITDDLPKNWLSPDWRSTGRVHDWRNYIPEPLQKRWHELSVETRMVAACLAEQAADKEQWD